MTTHSISNKWSSPLHDQYYFEFLELITRDLAMSSSYVWVLFGRLPPNSDVFELHRRPLNYLEKWLQVVAVVICDPIVSKYCLVRTASPSVSPRGFSGHAACSPHLFSFTCLVAALIAVSLWHCRDLHHGLCNRQRGLHHFGFEALMKWKTSLILDHCRLLEFLEMRLHLFRPEQPRFLFRCQLHAL